MLRCIAWIQNWYLSLNLFVDGSTNEEVVIRQKYSSRLFVCLFTTTVILLIFYSSLENHTSSVTVHNPSYKTFLSLDSKYSETLNCPCTTTAVEYTKFIQANFTLHQV